MYLKYEKVALKFTSNLLQVKGLQYVTLNINLSASSLTLFLIDNYPTLTWVVLLFYCNMLLANRLFTLINSQICINLLPGLFMLYFLSDGLNVRRKQVTSAILFFVISSLHLYYRPRNQRTLASRSAAGCSCSHTQSDKANVNQCM